MTTLGENLRRLMEAKGFNKKSLAREAGLKEGYVRDIIRARSADPSATRLNKVAMVLGVRIEDITGVAADADDVAHTFADRLKWVREFSTPDVALWATTMQVKTEQWEAYEAGTADMPHQLLAKFAKLTGCSPDFLLFGDLAKVVDEDLHNALAERHSFLLKDASGTPPDKGSPLSGDNTAPKAATQATSKTASVVDAPEKQSEAGPKKRTNQKARG